MELTPSFIELLRRFAARLHGPNVETFLEVVTGWVLSSPSSLCDRGHFCRWQHW